MMWIIISGAGVVLIISGIVFARRQRNIPPLDWPPVLQTPYRHISHRGASAYAPENTLEAFRIAVEQYHTDVIETDVHVSADGEVIIIHDPTVDRTTNGGGRIRDMALTDIRALDAGYRFSPDGGRTFPWRGKDVRIPTLREAFEAFPHVKFNVEIKQDHPSVEDIVVRTILECNAVNRVFLGSARKKVLARIKQQQSDIATFNCHRAVRRFLMYHWLYLHHFYKPTDYALQVMPRTPWITVVTPATLAFAHSKGMVVHVWTINEEAEMRRLLELGVDGVMTDYPDRLRKVLDEMETPTA